MAKKLKLNVKNTQFKAALNLNKLKKEKAELEKEKAAKKAAAVKAKKAADKQALEDAKKPPKAKPTAKSVAHSAAQKVVLKSPSKKEEKKAPEPVIEAKKPVAEEPKEEVKAPPRKPYDAINRVKAPPAKKPTTPATTLPPPKATLPVKKKKDQRPPTRRYQSVRPFDSRDRQGLRSGDDGSFRRRRSSKYKSVKQKIEIVYPTELKVRLPITVKDLAQGLKRKAAEIISKLFKDGILLTINDYLEDPTTVELIGHEFNCEITLDTSEEERIQITDKSIQEEISEAPDDKKQDRPPIVAFMGHVDHGKTSLIDRIRKSQIASGEAGAITQHIGAFKYHSPQGDLTILDTPGHEAFTTLRERGVTITDLVILVVAGDEGIKPQTDEAINQAKESNVPILVAINKCDKEGFNAENVYRSLADRELLPEAWGGSIVTVNCSAETGEGIDQLLEMLTLQADVLELQAVPDMRARGTVLESELHKGLGSVATLLIQNGTLKKGDALVLDNIYGRIKTMHDENSKLVLDASPATPVKVTGLSAIPKAGSEFIVVASEKEARKLSEERAAGQERTRIKRPSSEGFEALLEKHQEQAAKKILNIILRADVQGSLEALKASLSKIPSSKVELNFVSTDVGEISESDVTLAAASNAVIVGFHTRIESHADPLIREKGVKVALHDIIYHAIDDVKEMMIDTLDKERKETEEATLNVLTIFKSSKLGLIAGCQVENGTINRNHHVKLFRDGEQIFEGELDSIKRGKEDAQKVAKGYECGILIKNFNKVHEGDVIKSYSISFITQDLN